MSELRCSLDKYLTVRRALGFKLEAEGRLLSEFVAFADAAGVSTITTEVAVAWAVLPAEPHPSWLARRLRAVRGLARYLQALDPATEVPPVGLLPGRHHRPAPYLYSDDDIGAILTAARELSPPLRAATFETFLGLLAVTGLRVGEAMALDRSDIDWADGLLTVRDGKFGKSRLVPLHPSTIAALQTYTELRDQHRGEPPAPSLFVSSRGARLVHSSVYPTFRALLQHVGLDQPSSSSPHRPRMHDFRHSLAVKTLLGWYRDGGDVASRLPLLSTYLGHVSPASTYWYLSAAPELLALATDRLERAHGERP